jgi:hypothetical protein
MLSWLSTQELERTFGSRKRSPGQNRATVLDSMFPRSVAADRHEA